MLLLLLLLLLLLWEDTANVGQFYTLVVGCTGAVVDSSAKASARPFVKGGRSATLTGVASHQSVDPWNKVANIGVDAWHVGLGTVETERNKASQCPSVTAFANQWTTRVVLASVFASLLMTSTDHFFGDAQGHAKLTVDFVEQLLIRTDTVLFVKDWHVDVVWDDRDRGGI